ncbi:MAG TPA: thioredoxin [Rhabdochlamydiaceae bacterium]|nr:thioredoxin [Rhabdochlamydiaceae bacterium]
MDHGSSLPLTNCLKIIDFFLAKQFCNSLYLLFLIRIDIMNASTGSQFMSENLKKITEDNFEEEIKKGITLVDFYADWCGPCRMIAPHLESLAKELHGQATIAKLDVDHAQRISSTYQVTSVPTLILFREGKEMGRIVGVRDAKAIKEFILSAKN